MKSKSKSQRNQRPKVKAMPRKKQETAQIGLLGRALRALGSAGGAALGGAVGLGGAGAAAGGSLGAAVSRWLGAGDYEVSQNSIVRSAKASNGIPMMHTSGQSVVIRHREFITQVTGSINFTVKQELPINPGLSSTFPWLANIAASFQEYTIKGMVYHYVPTSGSAVASTNAALGSVMLQTSYRSTDSNPSTKSELLNEYWASESVPCEAFCHPIECDPKENPFNVQYVRSHGIPAEDSRLMYDLGKTILATSGQQVDNTVLGDLWVTYEIELRKPLLGSNVTSGAVDLWQVRSVGGTIASASGSIFPTDATTVTTSGLLPLVITPTTIVIPANIVGTFYFSITLGSNAGVNGAITVATPTYLNCTAATYYAGVTRDFTQCAASTTTRNVSQQFAVTKTTIAAPATITIGNYTIGGAGVFDYTEAMCTRLSL